MRVRRAACGLSGQAHPPHDFSQHEYGSSATAFVVRCEGRTAAEAAATVCVTWLRRLPALYGDPAGARLECGWRALHALTMLLDPDPADLAGPPPPRIDRLYGVTVALDPAADPGMWRLLGPGGQPAAAGSVP